jgi:hypothetical protein
MPENVTNDLAYLRQILYKRLQKIVILIYTAKSIMPENVTNALAYLCQILYTHLQKLVITHIRC